MARHKYSKSPVTFKLLIKTKSRLSRENHCTYQSFLKFCLVKFSFSLQVILLMADLVVGFSYQGAWIFVVIMWDEIFQCVIIIWNSHHIWQEQLLHLLSANSDKVTSTMKFSTNKIFLTVFMYEIRNKMGFFLHFT